MADIRHLPPPIVEYWDWQMRAACRDADPAVFFHPENERGPARAAREAAAKSVCVRCPVVAQCREFALASRETYGVWGGLSESEREELFAVDRRRTVRVAS